MCIDWQALCLSCRRDRFRGDDGLRRIHYYLICHNDEQLLAVDAKEIKSSGGHYAYHAVCQLLQLILWQSACSRAARRMMLCRTRGALHANAGTRLRSTRLEEWRRCTPLAGLVVHPSGPCPHSRDP